MYGLTPTYIDKQPSSMDWYYIYIYLNDNFNIKKKHFVLCWYTVLWRVILLKRAVKFIIFWNYFLDNVEARDFTAESRKKKLTRKLHISCLVQRIFSDSQITRSRINKEEIDEEASEKASHPSWSSAITRK